MAYFFHMRMSVSTRVVIEHVCMRDFGSFNSLHDGGGSLPCAHIGLCSCRGEMHLCSHDHNSFDSLWNGGTLLPCACIGLYS